MPKSLIIEITQLEIICIETKLKNTISVRIVFVRSCRSYYQKNTLILSYIMLFEISEKCIKIYHSFDYEKLRLLMCFELNVVISAFSINGTDIATRLSHISKFTALC